MIDKRVDTIAAALEGIEDGATILLAGFGDVGMPRGLLGGLIAHRARDLTLVVNAGGRDGSPISTLLETGRVRRLVCSFVRAESAAGRLLQAGQLAVEIVPQGTLAERLRAAASGIAAFYTPTGADTLLAEGREVREINGRNCILEYPLHGDVALLDAWAADRWGNLAFRESQRNFNPVMAMAAKCAIAEVQEFVDLGTLDPAAVATPGVFVDRVVRSPIATERAA
ncbi:MAG: 3-oxoacid CoA-transferase subunit A [Rhodospirillales bacterium]|nr:3-oxoacid CoA-transferase subunit A [Rhodospirillales bacterium]